MSHPDLPSSPADTNSREILEWLAHAHGRTGSRHTEELLRQLVSLRDTPLPNRQRIKLLDLLYGHVKRVVHHELPQLHEVTLPIARRTRHRVRILLDILGTLTQEYFNTLSELFDPQSRDSTFPPQNSLRRAVQAIGWQIRVAHLVASPAPSGLWQQLHFTYRTARALGIHDTAGPQGAASIERIYIGIILGGIAQPASFSSRELEFINDYIERCAPPIALSETPQQNREGIFWIDLDKDFPAHALVRRTPSPEIRPLYFCCDELANRVLEQRSQLAKGASAESLGLPPFAGSHTGPGILQRLHKLWGNPEKRRFTRRRQAYRAHLCAGLNDIWHLKHDPLAPANVSEWMVTNESPDGYALMHVSGQTGELRVGDVVALRTITEERDDHPAWHVSIVRWAISENPEHIELGLQILSTQALAAEVANFDAGIKVPALILPAKPPIRNDQALLLRTGLIRENSGRIVVLLERDNLEIRELLPTSLDEQTSSIEVFSVSSDDSR